MDIKGYSERGMIGAIGYEIAHSANGVSLLADLLGECIFPFSPPPDFSIPSAKLRVEQSFSDFGDLDLLVLVEGSAPQSFLLEAKVKTSQRNSWKLSKEWDQFAAWATGKKAPPSNLFVQLYRKMRLIRRVSRLEEDMGLDEFGRKWSLGKNPVVLRAARELSQYCQDAWLLALVPEEPGAAKTFFEETFRRSRDLGLRDWSIDHVGYVTWTGLETMCKRAPTEWQQTLSNFRYNEGQILPVKGGPGAISPPGSRMTLRNREQTESVVVVRRGRHNTRVRFEDGTTDTVPNGSLTHPNEA